MNDKVVLVTGVGAPAAGRPRPAFSPRARASPSADVRPEVEAIAELGRNSEVIGILADLTRRGRARVAP